MPKFLKRFIINRKGTAEVIGSVLFIIILLFAFTNIYLWHDNATKNMNTLLSDKLNSPLEVHWLLDDNGEETNTLVVTNAGGISASLSRLWIVTSGESSARHLYASFEKSDGVSLNIAAGTSIKIDLIGGSLPSSDASEITSVTFTSSGAAVPYTRTKVDR